MFITSCDFDDNLVEYEEQLVVFASINAGFPEWHERRKKAESPMQGLKR